MSRYCFHSPHHGVNVDVDRGSQVILLETTPVLSLWSLRNRPDASRFIPPAGDGDVIRTMDVHGSIPACLHTTLSSAKAELGWVPAMALALKAKAFDDGLVGTVELMLQRGTPRWVGKRAVVEHLHEQLLKHWTPDASQPLREALVTVRAALSLTGVLEECGRKLRLLVMQCLKEFHADPGRSKPLGIYTWSKELSSLFQQDRMLQTVVSSSAAATLREALRTEPTLWLAYQQHLRLMSRVTNGLSKPGLEGSYPEQCIYPPSASHESQIIKQLFPTNAPPPGFALVDELIARIRDGRLDTTPGEDSGWYDYQQHALVPFLVPDAGPESTRLKTGPGYRAELEKQFQALFALTRETHVKQLEMPMAGGIPLVVRPQLSIEPLAEFYRRRAESYGFVRRVLCDLLGSDVVLSASRLMHDGKRGKGLLDELVWMELLFRGASAIVREELGFDDPPEQDLAARAITSMWRKSWLTDPDLACDARCVVPLFHDVERKKTKVMAYLGFHVSEVNATYEQCPEVRVTDGQGRPVPKQVYFEPAEYGTVCPVTAEVYVDNIPNRKEFQKLCDAHEGDIPAILEALAR